MAAKTGKRVRTPTVIQMEAVECGAAALGIILAYHGRYLPLEELRVTCGVSRDGSKASNVVKAGRTYGLESSGKRIDIDALKEQPLPFIVFWNFNHFLVVEGFGKDKVYLNDPASGPRTVTDEEFANSYTGVALFFTPGPDFQKGGKPKGLFRAILPRLQGSRAAFTFAVLASLGLVIPGLVIPLFSQVFIDDFLIGQMKGWVLPLLVGMGITALLRAALTWLQQAQLLRLETRLSLTSSADFFWHVLRLPVGFFEQRYASDLSQRVAANARIANLLSGQLATNLVNIVSLVFYLVVMVQYSWVLTLVGVGITLLNLLTLKYVARVRKDGNLKMLQDHGKLMATTMNGIQSVETIQSTGAEADFFLRWSGYLAKVNNSRQKLEVFTRLLSQLPILLNTLTNVAILGFGGWLVMQGDLSVGMLVAFQSLMQSFTQPITKLMDLAGQAQEAEGDLRRLDDVLHYEVDDRLADLGAGEDTGEARVLEGRLEMKDIVFGYSRLEAPLIEGFHLAVEPGRRVALVGPSGSGKSTVAKLVNGLQRPWSGEILLDGASREQLPLPVLNSTQANVDQNIDLFEGTIRENLTLWDDSIPEGDILRATRDACIHEEISQRPGGYDGPIEEGGRNFSGGQRQRIEIARALVRNPRILVLDEATAALDPLTEKTIDDSIRRRGCTCVIIAHRLSTIRDCDEIIVLDRGQIVERGRHEELIAAGGAYQRMLEEAE